MEVVSLLDLTTRVKNISTNNTKVIKYCIIMDNIVILWYIIST